MTTNFPQVNIENIRCYDLLEISSLVLKLHQRNKFVIDHRPMWQKECTTRRKLAIPEKQTLFLTKLPMVAFKRFFSLFNKLLQLVFLWERYSVDSLQAVLSCIALPVTR